MSFNYNSRADFAKNLKQELMDSLSMTDIYTRYQGSINTNKRTIQTICPRCNKDNFTFYDSSCFCFSCKEKVSNIFDLYMLIHNSNDYYDALYTIARDFCAIDEDTYNLCISNNYSKKNSNYQPRINQKLLDDKKKEKEERAKKCPTAKRQSEVVIHNVCKVIKELSQKVTGKERYSLKKERGLSDDEIDELFFMLPKPSSQFYRELFAILKERFGYEPKDLIGVPGFYSYDMKKILLVKREGLGFIMPGSDGIVRGIHIRAYDEIDENGKMILHDKFDENGKKEKRPKYYWFGSEGFPNGCGPGSPVAVRMPKNKKSKVCFISEGVFKISTIVKEFNSPAISVQGVRNWEGKIAPEIRFINKNYNELSYIFCAYDADSCFNFSIFETCREMISEELKDLDLEVRIAVWDYKLGKGLDDMINNGHKDKLLSVNFFEFEQYFVPYMEKIFETYPNSTSTRIQDKHKNKIDEDIIHQIYKDMVLKPLNVYCL